MNTGLRQIALGVAGLLIFSSSIAQDETMGELTVGSGITLGTKPVLRDKIVATKSIGARDIE